MFKKRGRGALIAASLTATALVAAACGGGGGSGTESGQGSKGGSYSVSISEPDALGPHSFCYASECSNLLSVLYAGLVDLNEQGDLIMRAAESVTTEDQVHWTIKLKEGWTFHNGDPLNADAYIRAWNFAAYGPNAVDTNGFFSVIEGYDAMNGDNPSTKELSGLEKVDEYTFKVTLNSPFSQFKRSLLYTPAFGAVTEWCLNNQDKCNEKPKGTGPYKLVEWTHDQQVVLQKWNGYKGKNTGNADKITFKIYAERSTAFRDWQGGNLDILLEPPPENVPAVRQTGGDRFYEKTQNAFAYLGIPQYNDTWSPKQVHALSLAINRELVINQALAGQGEPATGIVPPNIPGGGGDVCDACTYDPEKAKRLMKEAGGLPVDEITIWFNSGSGHRAWITAIANMWRQTFGLDYTFKTPQFSDYLDTLENRKMTGPFRLGWIQDYPSMVNFLKPIFTSGFQSNYTGYSSEKFEQLIKKGNAADTQKQAINYYTQAEELVLDTMPVIPIYFYKTMAAWSDDVENIVYSALWQVPAFEKVKVTG